MFSRIIVAPSLDVTYVLREFSFFNSIISLGLFSHPNKITPSPLGDGTNDGLIHDSVKSGPKYKKFEDIVYTSKYFL